MCSYRAAFVRLTTRRHQAQRNADLCSYRYMAESDGHQEKRLLLLLDTANQHNQTGLYSVQVDSLIFFDVVSQRPENALTHLSVDLTFMNQQRMSVVSCGGSLHFLSLAFELFFFCGIATNHTRHWCETVGRKH